MKTVTYDDTKWKLVPIEPRYEELRQIALATLSAFLGIIGPPCREPVDIEIEAAKAARKAMLAAAPAQPGEGE